jgi:hypothetical protein
MAPPAPAGLLDFFSLDGDQGGGEMLQAAVLKRHPPYHVTWRDLVAARSCWRPSFLSESARSSWLRLS